MTSPTDDRKTLLREFFEEVWNAGNVAACDRFLAPTYVVHHDPGDPWHGKTLDLQGFKDRVSQSRAPFPDQRFEIRELVGKGDVIACSWLWNGTHLGQLAHFPPTGRLLTMSGITLYYFDATRITGHWQVADRLSIVQQLQQASTAPTRPSATRA